MLDNKAFTQLATSPALYTSISVNTGFHFLVVYQGVELLDCMGAPYLSFCESLGPVRYMNKNIGRWHPGKCA